MTKIIIGIVCILGIATGGFFIYTNSKNDTPKQTTNISEKKVTEGSFVPSAKNDESGTGTFRNLLGQGKNLACTISFQPENYDGIFNGTIFVSGERMSAHITSTISGFGEIDTNVIKTGDTMYVWGNTPAGKMALQFAIDANTPGSTTANNQFNLDEKVTYNCKAWTVEEIKFVPPSGITFSSQESLMPQSLPVSGNEAQGFDMGKAQCSSCNMITDADAKLQCLQTFSCN